MLSFKPSKFLCMVSLFLTRDWKASHQLPEGMCVIPILHLYITSLCFWSWIPGKKTVLYVILFFQNNQVTYSSSLLLITDFHKIPSDSSNAIQTLCIWVCFDRTLYLFHLHRHSFARWSTLSFNKPDLSQRCTWDKKIKINVKVKHITGGIS